MWRRFALFEHYGRMTLTLDEIAEQVGLAPGTIKNRRARGEFPWIRDEGRTLTCDVADLAEYLASQQRIAREAVQPTQPRTASESRPNDALSRPSGRRRRIQVPAAST